MGNIQISHYFSMVAKYYNISVTFIVRIKIEHKKIKLNKTKVTCTNLTVFFLIYKVVHYVKDF